MPKATKKQPPLDPRLLTEVRSARIHIIRTVALGLVEAVCAIVTAYLVALITADLLVNRTWPSTHAVQLVLLAVAIAIRALAIWYGQRTGHQSATETIAQLRLKVVNANAKAGRAREQSAGQTTALATAGLENLRPYLTGYIPQLALSLTVTPLALAAILFWDPTSALVALIALPLIPIFMILIGLMTQGASKRSLDSMRNLWGQSVDLIEGLPTLHALGRAKGSEKIVARLGANHKKNSITALAYAFLSSFALELIATLGVAIIAVSIGLRLVSGSMELLPAIAVLILAAEVYLPLRLVGQQFHASTDGLAALDAAFEIINTPAEVLTGASTKIDLNSAPIHLAELAIVSRSGLAPNDFSATITPGQIHVLVGESGAGKSSIIKALLGLIKIDSGEIKIADFKLADIDLADFYRQITFLPQRPQLGVGSLSRVLLEASEISITDQTQLKAKIAHASAITGFDKQVVALHGWDYQLGRGGSGLSVGQRQRLALTAALINPKPLVILDEPTAHLDGASEEMVISVIKALKQAGSTVLLTAHRETLIALADEVFEVQAKHELRKEV